MRDENVVRVGDEMARLSQQDPGLDMAALSIRARSRVIEKLEEELARAMADGTALREARDRADEDNRQLTRERDEARHTSSGWEREAARWKERARIDEARLLRIAEAAGIFDEEDGALTDNIIGAIHTFRAYADERHDATGRLDEARTRIAELEGALGKAAEDLRGECSNAFGGDDCIESNYSDDDTCFACRASRRASLAAERNPTPPASSSTTPAPERCDRCGEGDAEVPLGSALRWCKPCFASAQDEAEKTYYPTPTATAADDESADDLALIEEVVALQLRPTPTTPAPEKCGAKYAGTVCDQTRGHASPHEGTRHGWRFQWDTHNDEEEPLPDFDTYPAPAGSKGEVA